MLDFSNIQKYRENNRIEAKRALGGLPGSIWETYSAFANTLGGVILLGVEEHRDKSLHAVDLPDPDGMVMDFWDAINDPGKASVNILTDKNVQIREVEGKRIIEIVVPRAERSVKPVFVDGNPLTGSYRRNGEGDYRCTREEVQAMLRDAAGRTQDMAVLEKMGMDVFDPGTLARYRARMEECHPGHVWQTLPDTEFLYRLGAVDRGENGGLHPTAAGLLMFGYAYETVKEFPHYFLDYQEWMDDADHWTDRTVSTSGDWSGNVFDFYFRVCPRITRDVKGTESCGRTEDPAVCGALREALANCLINADYHGTGGLVIVKSRNEITISNPGGFRVDINAAKNGGISDPRNAALISMFNLIDIGTRAGRGLPNIYHVWKNRGWREPTIAEGFAPERTTLTLSVGRKPVGKTTQLRRDQVMDYLTVRVRATRAELADLLGVKDARVREILGGMTAEGILEAEGRGKQAVYKLREHAGA